MVVDELAYRVRVIGSENWCTGSAVRGRAGGDAWKGRRGRVRQGNSGGTLFRRPESHTGGGTSPQRRARTGRDNLYVTRKRHHRGAVEPQASRQSRSGLYTIGLVRSRVFSARRFRFDREPAEQTGTTCYTALCRAERRLQGSEQRLWLVGTGVGWLRGYESALLTLRGAGGCVGRGDPAQYRETGSHPRGEVYNGGDRGGYEATVARRPLGERLYSPRGRMRAPVCIGCAERGHGGTGTGSRSKQGRRREGQGFRGLVPPNRGRTGGASRGSVGRRSEPVLYSLEA